MCIRKKDKWALVTSELYNYILCERGFNVCWDFTKNQNFGRLIDWMVFYATFNSISVISQWQLTLFMCFLGFTSTRLGLWSVLPKDTPMKKPRGLCAAWTQDLWITSQPLYQWAMRDPIKILDWTELKVFADNLLPNNPYGGKNLLKTWKKKEKMLVTSIFSFSHNVFYPTRGKFHHLITH